MPVASVARLIDSRLVLGSLAVLVCMVTSTAPTPGQVVHLIHGVGAARACLGEGCADDGAGVVGNWGGSADAWQTFAITTPPTSATEVPLDPWAAAPESNVPYPDAPGQVPSGSVVGPLLDLTGPPDSGPRYEVITVGPPVPLRPDGPPNGDAPAFAVAAPPPIAPPLPTGPVQPSDAGAQVAPPEAGPAPRQSPPTSVSPVSGPLPATPPSTDAPAPTPTSPPRSTTAGATVTGPTAPSTSLMPGEPEWSGPDTAAHSQRWGNPVQVDGLEAGTEQWSVEPRSARTSNGSAISAVDPAVGQLGLTVPATQRTATATATWAPSASAGRWEVRLRTQLPAGCMTSMALVDADPQAPSPGTGPAFRSVDVAKALASRDPNLAGWHNWAIELTPTAQRFFVDGAPVGEVARTGAAGATVRAQVILSCSVSAASTPGSDRAGESAHVELDWAAHYE